ncbi:hypothetical protein J6590_032602 [Homalodisca vitripennis]|nr:hypothetical protein J6590_032602 [Homalodisca vitripennis]
MFHITRNTKSSRLCRCSSYISISLYSLTNLLKLLGQLADEGVNADLYQRFAKQQIDYMLGSSGRSYVVGYGEKYPTRPHHAASSCHMMPEPCTWTEFGLDRPNPQILYGALVSGPDENDFYQDKREDYVYNEVTLDYNAGFQSAVAGLRHLQLKGISLLR